jgi:hypothetical protein
MNLIGHLGLLANSPLLLDAGTTQSKLLDLSMLGVSQALLRILPAVEKRLGWAAGVLAKAMWTLFFLYSVSFFALTFFP